jgi:2-furoate---CoA ligase
MDLRRALSWTAERFPGDVAVTTGERSWTYAEWEARTNRLARAFAARGAGRGDRIVLAMANGEQHAAAHMAAQKLGALSTPLNVRFAAGELSYCLSDAEPAVVVTDDTTTAVMRDALGRLEDGDFALLHAGEDPPGDAEALEDLAAAQEDAPPEAEVGPDDASVMLYTSGTTGRPKGVPRTHRNEFSAALAHVVQARYGPGESTLGAMPMYHTMGLRSLLSMIVIGGKFVAMPAFKPSPALELIASERISSLYLVPTAFWALLQEGGLAEAGGSVTKLAYAGAAMTTSLTEELAEALDPDVFVNHYGATEVYTFSIEEDARARPDSAGRPGIHSRLRVVRADAEERVGPAEVVEPGETGEVAVSLESDEAFAGYWRRPDADEKALRDGWYFTGDLGFIGDDGRLRVAGRVDDMIITGGENVHPLEVEDAVGRCPQVAEVAVAGVDHEKWGQEVTAFVVATSEAGAPADAASAVVEWTRDASGLTSYKRPRRVVVLDEIPKSPVGKILRRKLVAGEFEALADSGERAGEVGSR